MSRVVRACLKALCGGLIGVVALSTQAQAQTVEVGRVIVRLKPDASVLRSSVVQAQSAGTSSEPMQRLGRKRGLLVADGRQIGRRMHVAVAEGMSSTQLAAVLAQDPDVLYAVPDQLRRPLAVSSPPSDPLYGNVLNTTVAAGQWYLRPYDELSNIRSTNNAASAWGVATGQGVRVAVLDSGVRFDHPDLTNKLLPGANMISYAAVAGTNTGRSTDAQDLGDWVTSNDITAINREVGGNAGCSVQPRSDWHGTKVAGIIGAQTDNGIGMASVAPDAMLLPVRVLGKCGGWDSDILAGMRWAAGLSVQGVASTSTPARVINMSLGAVGSCAQSYQDVIAELTALGVVVVVSAGNENGLAVTSPANCPGVIAVTGVRHLGTKVAFASVGQQVSLAAPGGNCVNEGSNSVCLYPILTTSNAGQTTPVSDGAGGSTYTDDFLNPSYGTSFAAPQVSGAAALLLEVRPDLTPAAVRSVLMAAARSFPTSGGSAGIGQCRLPDGAVQNECYCTSLTCGAGMLDVAAAVQMAATRAVPVIQVSNLSPRPGDTVVLSAQGSLESPGHTGGLRYQWELVSSGGIVNDTGWAAQAPQVSVTPSGPGQFQVRLTVQDVDDTDPAHATQVSQWIVVTTPPSSGGSGVGGGGGGGGAPDAVHLLALMLMAAGVAWQRLRA